MATTADRMSKEREHLYRREVGDEVSAAKWLELAAWYARQRDCQWSNVAHSIELSWRAAVRSLSQRIEEV